MCGILALLFLAVPIAEIFVILKVGGLLGLLPTIAIIAVTAVVGASLARSQGLAAIRGIQESLLRGQEVGQKIVEGALVLAAGVTLLAPGFITDFVGLSLLLPPVRAIAARSIVARYRGRVATSVGMPMGFGGFSASPGAGPDGADDEDPPPPGVIDV